MIEPSKVDFQVLQTLKNENQFINSDSFRSELNHNFKTSQFIFLRPDIYETLTKTSTRIHKAEEGRNRVPLRSQATIVYTCNITTTNETSNQDVSKYHILCSIDGCRHFLPAINNLPTPSLRTRITRSNSP